jgi:galactose-1-phosphate uridylyltransferase
LLTEISDRGIDTKNLFNELLSTNRISMEVLKFINDNRPLEVSQFFERLRNNYNNKKSKLYKEIVQIDQKEPKDIVVTLSSLLTQILLYSNQVDDKQMFLKHSRAEEISKVLNNYFKTYDTKLCIQMLVLIKADLKALESIK